LAEFAFRLHHVPRGVGDVDALGEIPNPGLVAVEIWAAGAAGDSPYVIDSGGGIERRRRRDARELRTRHVASAAPAPAVGSYNLNDPSNWLLDHRRCPRPVDNGGVGGDGTGGRRSRANAHERGFANLPPTVGESW